jgi:hypothetical protein
LELERGMVDGGHRGYVVTVWGGARPRPSQLIRGVGRTLGGNMIGLTRKTAAAAVLVAGLCTVAGGADDETQLYAAAIRHVAKATGCTKKAPCCFSVAGKVPNQELAKLLSSAAVKPIQESVACSEMTLDAQHVPTSASTYERVLVAAGLGGSSLNGCTYALQRTRKGWEVVPSQTACPVE